jgi:enolase
VSSVHEIVYVHGRRIWGSRGRPTVEAEVVLAGGAVGRASAPSGASTGSFEALDLRDGGESFGGRDVVRAVAGINGTIAPLLIGMNGADQAAVDQALIDLDGTPEKKRLGANATIAVSMALAHAAAGEAGVPLFRHLGGEEAATLPLPMIQIFGGGAHAAGRIDVQDFLVVCPAARSFAEALDMTAEVYRAAGALLDAQGRRAGVADEGGYWPMFDSPEQALTTLTEAIDRAGYDPGAEMAIALDIAAGQLASGDGYRFAGEHLSTAALSDRLAGWVGRFPIVSIEDPLGEDDFAGFAALAARLEGVQIVGDDLLVTDPARIARAAEQRSVNAVLLKPNQRGTLTETRRAWQAARDAGLRGIVSARSGETEDTTIVHLAVGWGVGQLKVGSIARGERTAKWNEALRIEEALGPRARFAGRAALAAR